MPSPTASPAPGQDHGPTALAAVNTVAQLWCGRFDNSRQVQANLARGGPAMPELSREHRALEVVRLAAPQLGSVVLYLQECRETVPLRAHRQRVMRLRPAPAAGADAAHGSGGMVLVEQLFFGDGPTYDRPLLAADQVAGLGEEAFQRYPGCDLLVWQEPALQRWRGEMRPGACRYQHPIDGEVCAEFAMLLSEGQHGYRDRSLRLADGSIRGEVDGFSWLLFDRLPTDCRPALAAMAAIPALALQALPALAAQMGVWQGTFRRYDAAGQLLETVASTVVQRLQARDGRWHYSQTSLLPGATTSPQRIEATGVIEAGRLHFVSERLRGWAMDVAEAPGTAVLLFESTDGSGLQMREISQLVEGGRRRLRTTQTLRQGVLLSRTHIEECKTSEDWQHWTAPADLEG
ncbi:MAG: CpcT/CpeT family chromophore lyase [Synechococcaceae cyanobacterium]|nr:CpcT/CpeT family chromophore lyase [Synechococcaceae cyanobacterium]